MLFYVDSLKWSNLGHMSTANRVRISCWRWRNVQRGGHGCHVVQHVWRDSDDEAPWDLFPCPITSSLLEQNIGVLRDKPPHEGKNSGWIQWYEESFMSNVWHLALIMYMDRHTLGLQNRNLSLKIYIMNMVGYKLMQKYVLLSLFHDFTKRIILWYWVLKRSEETLWLCSQYMLLQCWSCISNTLVFNTQPRITNR